jgi:hypothetical protein
MPRVILLVALLVASFIASFPARAADPERIRAEFFAEKKLPIATIKAHAESGNAVAQAVLAEACQSGQRMEKDFGQALHWARLAAAQGHPIGIYLYGNRFFYGSGVQQDKARGVALFKLAADAGDSFACMHYGEIRCEGVDAPLDTNVGLAYLEKAALTGLTRALDRYKFYSKRLAYERAGQIVSGVLKVLPTSNVKCAICGDTGKIVVSSNQVIPCSCRQ